MSLNRFRAAASSTTQYVANHLSALTQSDVPNYRVSGTAVVELTLLTLVSAMDSCSSVTTQLGIAFTLANGILFLNQNYDTSCDYASKGFTAAWNGTADTINAVKESEWMKKKTESVSNSINAVKESEWVKKKTESVSKTWDFYFGTGDVKPKTATYLNPIKKTVESDSEHSEEHDAQSESGSALSIKKTQ